MKIITRREAKNLLRQKMVKDFSSFERRAILEELWLYCDSEERFDAEDLAYYPLEIRREMLAKNAPDDPDDPKYDFIIADRIAVDIYRGVRNQYLVKLLREEGLEIAEVRGEKEKMEHCRCCAYQSITPGPAGMGETCPVCLWVNFTEAANKMSLTEARKNFRAFGVIHQALQPLVSPDRKEKYAR